MLRHFFVDYFLFLYNFIWVVFFTIYFDFFSVFYIKKLLYFLSYFELNLLLFKGVFMDGREILKAMAQQAKDRLRARNNKGIVDSCDSNIRTIVINANDEKLYSKVKDVVNSDSYTPIADLIDINYYKTLNKEQKERYFFELCDKYRKLKFRYEQEKLKQVF